MKIYFSLMFIFICAGCSGSVQDKGNIGQMQSYPIPVMEAEWIRNGEPIQFEDEMWYPVDEIENFLDSEIYLVGEYEGVQFFIEKTDVRPYRRLYTKFGKNKFRVFEPKEEHD